MIRSVKWLDNHQQMALMAVLIIVCTLLHCFAQSLAAASSESLSDGESLLQAMVKWHVNLPTWVGNDPCQPSWEGVLCNNDHRVIYLNLSQQGLQGPIPLEIGNLSHLETLDLSNLRGGSTSLNMVTGDLSALKGLTELQILNLTFNNIDTSFPQVILTLKNLKDLRIDNNQLQGQIPKEIGGLTKLEYLYLGNNSRMFGPLPEELSNLINLKELSVWNVNLSSTILPSFGKLINLEYLNLHNCYMYGGLPSEMGTLANITNISLYSNLLTGPIPDTWKSLTRLKNLLLHKNYLTKSLPAWINEMPALNNLSLSYNYFYGPLPSLQDVRAKYIDIDCNFFTGAAPPPWWSFSGNCFEDSDSNSKIKCEQAYHDCAAFEPVASGGCPTCPVNQVLEDSKTCVCTFGKGGGGGSELKVIVVSIVGVGSFLFLLALVWLMWARYRRRGNQPPSRNYGRYFEAQGPVSDFWECPDSIVRFNLEDLARVTDDFNSQHEIGMGGFGKVFYAVLEGRDVAIKRAHLSSIQSSSSFRNEVLLLSRLHHKNLVRLLGFCEDYGIQILVYEYMPNGNLHKLLFKNNVVLDWLKRLDIAIGVAHGLEYLHSFADPPVIHRDIKPSNILLDDNLVAKLSDFGISKVAQECDTHVITRPAGTVGYIDPQYILREKLTTASDVYSFGMVLLELISGQKSIDNRRMDECNLVEWVKLKLDSDGFQGVVDPRLGNRFPSHIYQDMLRLAIDCASFNSAKRPSMKAVVAILDSCRWSIAPHLSGLPNDGHVHQPEEDIDDTDQQEHVRYMERGTTVRTSNTFSVSSLLPR